MDAGGAVAVEPFCSLDGLATSQQENCVFLQHLLAT